MYKKFEPILLNSIEELTPQLIIKLLQDHTMYGLPRIKKLRRYYEGKQDILKRTFVDQSKPNNRIVANFCKMISDITQGYFMGTPVNYIATNETALIHLQDVYNYTNEKNQNSLLAKDASIFGIGYELLYLDQEANIKLITLPVEEVIMIYSTTLEKKPIGAIRHYWIRNYLEPNKDYQKIELYTSDKIYYFDYISGGSLRLTEEADHYFGIVPVIPYMNNDEEQGDFEGIIGLQDAYNNAVSDQANDFEYMADSYLVITGAEDTADEEFMNMKQNRLILLNETGTASWLVKQTDNATIESYKNRLTKDIHRFSNVPDINSEEFTNDISGTAIRYRWQALEQVCSNKERLFAEALLDRQKAIFNILAIKGIHFDYATITPIFKRNIPVNSNEIVQIVSTLQNVVSKETLLAQLPFIDDVQMELDKIEKEQQDPYGDAKFENAFANKIAPEEEQQDEEIKEEEEE